MHTRKCEKYTQFHYPEIAITNILAYFNSDLFSRYKYLERGHIHLMISTPFQI